MVEDVGCFEKEFIELSWLTCQTKFTPRQRSWVLGLVKKLCEYPSKPIIHGCRSSELNIAIKVRIKYGGMKCDMRMLENIHSAVYSIGEIEYLTEIEDLAIENRQPFLAAMDHHISSIHKNISRKTGIDSNKIKKIIWKYRSSVNTREYFEEPRSPLIDKEAWWLIGDLKKYPTIAVEPPAPLKADLGVWPFSVAGEVLKNGD